MMSEAVEAVEMASQAAGSLSAVDYKTTAVIGLVMLALGGGTGTLLSGVSQDKHDALVADVASRHETVTATMASHNARIERLEDRERDLFIAITQIRQEQTAQREYLERIDRKLDP